MSDTSIEIYPKNMFEAFLFWLHTQDYSFMKFINKDKVKIDKKKIFSINKEGLYFNIEYYNSLNEKCSIKLTTLPTGLTVHQSKEIGVVKEMYKNRYNFAAISIVFLFPLVAGVFFLIILNLYEPNLVLYLNSIKVYRFPSKLIVTLIKLAVLLFSFLVLPNLSFRFVRARFKINKSTLFLIRSYIFIITILSILLISVSLFNFFIN